MTKTILIFLLSLNGICSIKAQSNTSPLPTGETKIGGHLYAGAGNEIWSSASNLYFNYQ